MTFIMNKVVDTYEKDKLMTNFKKLDMNGDGILTKLELIQGFMETYSYLNYEQAEVIVQQVMSCLDADGDDKIQITEFLIGTVQREELISLERLKKAFQLLDRDGDGSLEKKEFKEILVCIDMKENEKKRLWNKFLVIFDKDGDGKVSIIFK